MTKQFTQKVLTIGSVDTRKYRYIVKECHNCTAQWAEIHRLPLSVLDTTAAIDGWEVVWSSRNA